MIVTICNEKGGVGRTTTACNISGAIAEKGLQTLLVDLDDQANASLSYLERSKMGLSVYEALTEPGTSFKDVIHRSPILHLDIAPARISLAKLEGKLVGEMDSHFRLKDKIQSIVPDYDYIVVDT